MQVIIQGRPVNITGNHDHGTCTLVDLNDLTVTHAFNWGRNGVLLLHTFREVYDPTSLAPLPAMAPGDLDVLLAGRAFLSD